MRDGSAREGVICRVGVLGLSAALLASCGTPPGEAPEPEPLLGLNQSITCSAGCGAALGAATLPAPGGAVSLTAWSNSPQLGTDYDCDATPCAGSTPGTAANGQRVYGCAWQCVELVNRYLQGTWGDPKIAANAGPSFCQYAASSSLPQYYVYGQYGAPTSGHAPVVGD